ncbi:hypothetical protein [Pseudomonas sp. 5P_3.1_Bac2]|uniref:hypothetical protein n=1 Tax=Pseudomonas sp. 5P_3.1_Bac2 TaxID=2971617 RepID=UPI0021C6DE8E|nr:hypothetical protein [Pseudomonas sp. 5P_3.1_Bac2]MCU1717194.1 hypothetical protein [Pseudomonas sp. 5P_3.1_Bac2]
MMIETGIYVRIQELEGGPKPLPSCSGFNTQTAYRAIGMFNPSETSDAYFILSNDRDETWFICNRHVRIVGVFPTICALRIELCQFTTRLAASS